MARKIWTGPDERGRLAPCLVALYDQVQAAFPGRDTESDGSIGDAAHQNRKSEHNADKNGIVRAIDLDEDEEVGFDTRRFAEQIIKSRDDRVLYMICDRQMVRSYPKEGTVPWQWAPYTGDNPHTMHIHISVVDVPVAYNDTRPWKFETDAIANDPSSSQFKNIKATVFNDGIRPGTEVAYPPFTLPADFLGYSVPGRISGDVRIRVTNRANGRSTVLQKADIGPWYDGRDGWPEDRWWETNTRPRAEVDSRTNGAGIDLTPAAAKALGISVVEKNGRIVAGEAQVDVDIVGAEGEVPMASEIDDLNKKFDLLTKQITSLTKIVGEVVDKMDRGPGIPVVVKPKPVPEPEEEPEPPGTSVPITGPVPVTDPTSDKRWADIRVALASVAAMVIGPVTGTMDPVGTASATGIIPVIGLVASLFGVPGTALPLIQGAGSLLLNWLVKRNKQ